MTLPGEIGRKLIHLSSLAIPIGYLFLPRDFVLRVIIAIAAGSLILDLARLRNRLLGKTFLKVSKSLLKKDERARLTGSTYLLLASVVCVFFFPRPIAIAALLFLALGDPAASFVGKRVGRIHIGKKPWRAHWPAWALTWRWDLSFLSCLFSCPVYQISTYDQR
jgi:dolichol kinase